jgi:hypothetical protein
VLKPQDIVVAFHLLQRQGLSQREMAVQVGLSQPEISNALKRLHASRLLLGDGRTVVVPHLLELCVHGVKYFFPPVLGHRRGGLPTVTLAPPLKGKVAGEDTDLVWPVPRGTARANSLEPIHPCAVHAAQNDERVYELLVVLDGIRIGGNRIRSLSEEILAELVNSTENTHAAR